MPGHQSAAVYWGHRCLVNVTDKWICENANSQYLTKRLCPDAHVHSLYRSNTIVGPGLRWCGTSQHTLGKMQPEGIAEAVWGAWGRNELALAVRPYQILHDCPWGKFAQVNHCWKPKVQHCLSGLCPSMHTAHWNVAQLRFIGASSGLKVVLSIHATQHIIEYYTGFQCSCTVLHDTKLP